jgi:putative polyhydroxyalkanoate system protein
MLLNRQEGESKCDRVAGFFAMRRCRAGIRPAGLASWRLVQELFGRQHHMADINIVQAHSLSPAKAREAAQKVADKMARDYQLDCQWRDNVLSFERSGVHGALTLGEQRAEMVIRLGFLMSAFSSTIETKVAENMRKVFGGA